MAETFPEMPSYVRQVQIAYAAMIERVDSTLIDMGIWQEITPAAAIVLADVEPLPFRPMKGALGFFDPDQRATQTPRSLQRSSSCRNLRRCRREPMVEHPNPKVDAVLESFRKDLRLILQDLKDIAERLGEMAEKTNSKRPCGECHLQSGEVCDICGARRPIEEPRSGDDASHQTQSGPDTKNLDGREHNEMPERTS